MGFFTDLMRAFSGRPPKKTKKFTTSGSSRLQFDKLKAENDIRIVNESMKIIKNTKNDTTRENRLYLAREHLESLKQIIRRQPQISAENLDLIEKKLTSLEQIYLGKSYTFPEKATKENAPRIIDDLSKKFLHDTQYRPEYCYLADAYYKIKDYEAAIVVGLELHNRAVQQWQYSNLPTAPLDVVGKSYRALAKHYKKHGEVTEAIGYFEKLIEIDRATQNDRKILTQLKQE